MLRLSASIAAVFIVAFVTPYLRLDPTQYGMFWSRRYWLLAHLVPGTIALALAPVQYGLDVTRKHMAWHRTFGRIYGVCVVLSSVAAIVLALTNTISWVYGLGVLGLAAARLTTTGMAWRAARNRRFDQHQDWMVRSMVVTFGFV